jgi:hypothetical protein
MALALAKRGGQCQGYARQGGAAADGDRMGAKPPLSSLQYCPVLWGCLHGAEALAEAGHCSITQWVRDICQVSLDTEYMAQGAAQLDLEVGCLFKLGEFLMLQTPLQAGEDGRQDLSHLHRCVG